MQIESQSESLENINPEFFANNFLAFAQLVCNEVFGFDDDSDFLRDMCEFYDGIWKKVIDGEQVVSCVSAPVQHGKTTKTLIWAAYIMGQTQGKIPINYFCADDKLRRRAAKEFLKICESPCYKWIFGDFFANVQSSDGIYSLPDADIGFRICGGGHTGFPSSISIIDDPYKSRADAFSKTKLEEVNNFFEADIFSRLTPAYAVIVLHSRWHTKDLISKIESDASRWNAISFKRAAINENHESLMPDWRPLHWLENQKATLGGQMFAALYQQSPLESAASPFDIDAIQRYEELPRVKYYITCDPANSKSESADYTTMCVFGVDEGKKFYLVDGIHDRLNIHERSSALRKLYDKYSPVAIGYERYGMQTDIDFIQAERQANLLPRLPIIEMAGRASKEDRILRLVGLFNLGILKLPQSPILRQELSGAKYDFTCIIINELLDFPIGEHDDAIDALSRIVDISTARPAHIKADEPIKGTAQEIFYRLKNKKTGW